MPTNSIVWENLQNKHEKPKIDLKKILVVSKINIIKKSPDGWLLAPTKLWFSFCSSPLLWNMYSSKRGTNSQSSFCCLRHRPKTKPVRFLKPNLFENSNQLPADTARLNVLLRRRFGPSGYEPMCQNDYSGDKAPVEDRGVQTEPCSKSATFSLGSTTSSDESAANCIQDGQITPPPTPAIKRDLDECLSIYESVVSFRRWKLEDLGNLGCFLVL